MINLDEYGEVVNSPETYQHIAQASVDRENILIGWTDEAGSHYDILFTHGAITPNDNRKTVQGGIKPDNDLFISIMRKGAFGFAINNTWTSPGYFGEKLMPSGAYSETLDKLAELINGVKYALYKLLNN